jgi:hypothetical protein
MAGPQAGVRALAQPENFYKRGKQKKSLRDLN